MKWFICLKIHWIIDISRDSYLEEYAHIKKDVVLIEIVRDENMNSVSVSGVYPSGEGAGYAGGIMSAAMDGIKVAEAIALKFKPCYD